MNQLEDPGVDAIVKSPFPLLYFCIYFIFNSKIFQRAEMDSTGKLKSSKCSLISQ